MPIVIGPQSLMFRNKETYETEMVKTLNSFAAFFDVRTNGQSPIDSNFETEA